MFKIFLLLIIYQIKHFICDYPLQGRYMLGKFLPFPKFILPLLAHALVHGVATFLIALMFKDWKVALALGILDATVHFCVDRVKASPSMLGKFQVITKKDYQEHVTRVAELETKISVLATSQETLEAAADVYAQLNEENISFYERMKSNTYFWWSLGADQMAHHLTHYFIIWKLLS